MRKTRKIVWIIERDGGIFLKKTRGLLHKLVEEPLSRICSHPKTNDPLVDDIWCVIQNNGVVESFPQKYLLYLHMFLSVRGF